MWTTDLQPASLSAFFLRVPQAEPCRRPDNGSYPLSTGVLAQVHIWVPPTLLDTTLQAFEATLQGVVTAGVVLSLSYPSPAAPVGKIAHLSLLHLRFACGVAGDSYLLPIRDAVAQGKGKTEGMFTLNQALMRGMPSCQRVFGGRAHFSASLPLLDLVNNVSLMDPYLYQACTGRRFTPWLTSQGKVDTSTCGGADTYLLNQQLDRRLVSTDSLQKATRVLLTATSPTKDALRNLGIFTLIVLHLFYVGGRHSNAVMDLLLLNERLEDLHIDV